MTENSNVIDSSERIIKKISQENTELRKKLQQVVERVVENERIMNHFADIEALFSAVPKSALKSFDLDLPSHQPEFRVEAYMRTLAGKNHPSGVTTFLPASTMRRTSAESASSGV